MALTDEDKQWLAYTLESLEKRLMTVITDVKESLEREIGGVDETVRRMEARLDKIAAGSHYVTRLVEWSEKQDAFQLDILRRVQALEQKLGGRNGKT
jgi:hypothetical protein